MLLKVQKKGPASAGLPTRKSIKLSTRRKGPSEGEYQAR